MKCSLTPRCPRRHAGSTSTLTREYTAPIASVRWIVMHMIEETATHSGHLEIARELLDGKTGITGR